MSPPEARRRELIIAVVACAVGAGLALFAATRTWSVEVVSRPAPLPALREARTGSALLPWLPAVAAVGLAGTGALLATRGVARRVVGLVLLLVGVVLGAAGGYGLLGLDRGAAGAVAMAWPGLTACGGLLAAAGAVATLARGGRWPAMGARYERAAARRAGAAEPGRSADDPRSLWDALDRGEDPTLG